MSGIQVQTELKIHPRVSTYSIKLDFGHFTFLFCGVGQRNVPEIIMRVQTIGLLIKTYCFVAVAVVVAVVVS